MICKFFMRKITLSILIIFSSFIVCAQIYAPVKWSCTSKKISKTDVILLLKATIDDSWHIYSIHQPEGGPTKTTFIFKPSEDFTLAGQVQEPMPVTHFEEAFKMDVGYFEKSVIFQQRIKLKKIPASVTGKVSFMACTNEKCLPPGEVEFNILVK